MISNFKKLNFSFTLLFVLPLSFLLVSCDILNTVDELVIPDQHKGDFVIKKGKHYSNNGPKKMNTKLMRFEVKFDSTAIYTTKNPKNQADINKLYGMSDCGSKHQTNSARFGWRWYNNQLEILAYTYVNKERAFKFIRAVEIGETYTYELRLEDNQYVFYVDGVKTVMPRNCSGDGDGYLLYPYFGGDEPAPHNINISIKNLL